MSEKRFKGYAEKTGRHHELIIIDSLGEEYSITDDFFKSKDLIFEIVYLLNVMNDTLVTQSRENHKLTNKLNEQQELIEELQVSDEMGWKRAEHFEKKCPKELHNKKMYIKRLEYKVQKYKEENEQLKEELNNLKKDETMLYHYYTLARYGGDGV